MLLCKHWALVQLTLYRVSGLLEMLMKNLILRFVLDSFGGHVGHLLELLHNWPYISE